MLNLNWNDLKHEWPLLVIYFTASDVLYSANVSPLGWSFWAMFGLFILHGWWIRLSANSRHYDNHLANCERCEKFRIQSQNSSKEQP